MVARVVNIDIDQGSASKVTHSIVVRYLQRPGAGGRAALAFGLNGRFNDEDQVEEEENDDDDETFEWTDVLATQWRVIKL